MEKKLWKGNVPITTSAVGLLVRSQMSTIWPGAIPPKKREVGAKPAGQYLCDSEQHRTSLPEGTPIPTFMEGAFPCAANCYSVPSANVPLVRVQGPLWVLSTRSMFITGGLCPLGQGARLRHWICYASLRQNRTATVSV